jgi:CHAT domain-containing protein
MQPSRFQPKGIQPSLTQPSLSQPGRDAQTGSGRVALIAGPGLDGAVKEIELLHALYPDATVMTHADATVANTLSALARFDVVHLACHGTFRPDSPLFSSLRLVDGPMNVHDIDSALGVPEILVLSACEGAVNSVGASDDLLGTGGALLSLGVGAIVAPVLHVPDTATASVMLDVHRAMSTGLSPEAALASARAMAVATGDVTQSVAAQSFVVIRGASSRVI